MQQLERAERRVRAGDAAQIEVIRAESGVAERLERIIRADSLVRRTQRELKRVIHRPDLPINSPTAVMVATEPNPLWLDLDPTTLAEYAIDNRIEMLELELRLAIDASTVEFQRNQALPLFVLDYSYSLNGLGSSWNNDFDQIGDAQFNTWALGVRAEVPIGNEAAKSRVHRAIVTRLQRLATREQRKLSIGQEVFNALDSLEEAWQRILAARQAARLAGRTLQAEQRQFDVGLRTSTDVLDAAARLADSQSQEVRALADYQIAQVDLAFATGTLLGSARVGWEPVGMRDTAEAENWIREDGDG